MVAEIYASQYRFLRPFDYGKLYIHNSPYSLTNNVLCDRIFYKQLLPYLGYV